MTIYSLDVLLFNHFQFALIHGPNFPGSYSVLLFTALDLGSITSHIHNWVLFLLWFHLFILSGVISPLICRSILGSYRPGEFIFQCPIFLHFYTVYGKNTEVVCRSLFQWTTFCQNSPLWPIHLGWPYTAHSFIELDKAVVHVISLVSFLWFSFCLLSDGEGWEAYGSFLMGETDCRGNWVLFWWVGPWIFNAIFCWWEELCSLPAVYLRPNYGGGNEDNGDECYTQCPQPYSRPPPTHASTRDSWTLMGKSGSVFVGSLLLSPGSGVHKVLFVAAKILFPQSCVSSSGSVVS